MPHDQRWALQLPPLPQIKTYLMDTLETTLELLEKTPETDAALYFFRLALCHEDMHGEALIETAQILGCPLAIDVPGAMAARVRRCWCRQRAGSWAVPRARASVLTTSAPHSLSRCPSSRSMPSR